MNDSPPAASVHGILQAGILERVAVSFFRRSSWPRDQSLVSCSAGRFFANWVTKETQTLEAMALIMGVGWRLSPAMYVQNLGMKSYLETGFEEVVKLNWIHAGSEWALHPMTNVFMRERRRSGYRDTGEEDHVKVEGELFET